MLVSVTVAASTDDILLDNSVLVEGSEAQTGYDDGLLIMPAPSAGGDDGVNIMPVYDPLLLEELEYLVPDLSIMPDEPDIPDIPKPLDPSSLGNRKIVIEYNSDSIIVFEDYIFNWDDDEIHPAVYSAHIPILEIPILTIPDLKYEEEIISIGDLNKNAPYIPETLY